MDEQQRQAFLRLLEQYGYAVAEHAISAFKVAAEVRDGLRRQVTEARDKLVRFVDSLTAEYRRAAEQAG